MKIKVEKQNEKRTSVETQVSNEELEREYDYLLAEEITERLFSSGLISKEEFDKIMEKNKDSFSPLLARI